MTAWETMTLVDQPSFIQDFAEIWRAADKIVYSRSLEEVETSRTKLERAFDPEAVRALKASGEREIGIGGPELAGQALEADLVDEIHLLLVPVAVGAGKPALPIEARIHLQLLDHRSFQNGTIYLGYGRL
jgi:dihydrofolate reductase